MGAVGTYSANPVTGLPQVSSGGDTYISINSSPDGPGQGYSQTMDNIITWWVLRESVKERVKGTWMVRMHDWAV
jgi:hypothetical protein